MPFKTLKPDHIPSRSSPRTFATLGRNLALLHLQSGFRVSETPCLYLSLKHKVIYLFSSFLHFSTLFVVLWSGFAITTLTSVNVLSFLYFIHVKFKSFIPFPKFLFFSLIVLNSSQVPSYFALNLLSSPPSPSFSLIMAPKRYTAASS